MAVGDGFVLLFAGSPGDGSHGGVGLLLSPPAVMAWRAAGSKSKAWPGGRLLHVTFGLGGSEGVWHWVSVHGPTMQCDEAVKDAFYSSLSSFWAWRFSNPDAAGAPDTLYLLFIDLKKAFDAVPREEMFSLLSRCLHLPAHVIGMLRSLHGGMTTSHCHSGRVGPPINMSTGVRQGSVEGPTLYLLYYSLLLRDFRTRCAARFPDPVGVPRVTNRDGIFRIPSKVRRAKFTTVQLHGATYADDSLILDTDWDRFRQMASLLDDCLRDWGAKLNKVKTEWMEIPSLRSPIQGQGLPAFAADDAAAGHQGLVC